MSAYDRLERWLVDCALMLYIICTNLYTVA